MTQPPDQFIDTREISRKIKHDAKVALYRALRNGVLIRPDTCQICEAQPGYTSNGKSNGGRRALIEGHHHNGYDDPLDVQWLCASCHQRVHAHRHGILHPEEVKNQIAESLKAAYIEGRRTPCRDISGTENPFYGKKHTDETRKYLSEVARNRPRVECLTCGRLITNAWINRHQKVCNA